MNIAAHAKRETTPRAPGPGQTGGAPPALRRSGAPKNEHRTPCKARNEKTGAGSTPGRPFSTIIGGLNYEIQHSQCGTDMRSTSKNHNDTPCTVRNGLLWTADILVRIMGCLDLRKDEDACRDARGPGSQPVTRHPMRPEKNGHSTPVGSSSREP